MGSFDQATGLDDAVDQLLLAVWIAADMVRLRRVAGNRLAAGEAAFLELRDCSAGDRERQDAALPRAGVVGGGLYPGIAGPGFHVSLLRLMSPFHDMQFGDRKLGR